MKKLIAVAALLASGSALLAGCDEPKTVADYARAIENGTGIPVVNNTGYGDDCLFVQLRRFETELGGLSEQGRAALRSDLGPVEKIVLQPTERTQTLTYNETTLYSANRERSLTWKTEPESSGTPPRSAAAKIVGPQGKVTIVIAAQSYLSVYNANRYQDRECSPGDPPSNYFGRLNKPNVDKAGADRVLADAAARGEVRWWNDNGRQSVACGETIGIMDVVNAAAPARPDPRAPGADAKAVGALEGKFKSVLAGLEGASLDKL